MYLVFAINICRFHKAEGVQQEKDMELSKMYVWVKAMKHSLHCLVQNRAWNYLFLFLFKWGIWSLKRFIVLNTRTWVIET